MKPAAFRAVLFVIISFLIQATCATALLSLKSLAYDFTLAALNETLPNANGTGSPLVLGQNGASAGMSFQVTSTWASYPYNDFPFLSLANGSLHAHLASGISITSATIPRIGHPLGWVTSTLSSHARPAATEFSVTWAPAYRFPMLAFEGKYDLWSLCPFGDGLRAQTNVVYDVDRDERVQNGWTGFDVRKCYKVRVHVVDVASSLLV